MKKLRSKGFTLIELIVVIAIIAILMLILVPTMNGFVVEARKEANLANAKAVYTAMAAQDTAAKSGLGNFVPIAMANGQSCKKEISNLDEAFYSEDLSDQACIYDKELVGLFVSWGTGKEVAIYPSIGKVLSLN